VNRFLRKEISIKGAIEIFLIALFTIFPHFKNVAKCDVFIKNYFPPKTLCGNLAMSI